MDWFERLTGFKEGDYHWTRSQMTVRDQELRSSANGRTYQIGRFEMPALAELRNLSAAYPYPSGRFQISLVVGDVRRMHGLPDNENTLFQVASQFNALEMVGPRVSPEDGVTRYPLAWQCLCNLYLDMEKIDHMVDARSYQELGIFDSQPSTHIGPRNFAALKDENKKKPENAVCVDKSRRRKRKIADGWSLDSETLSQLINTHLDLARLEAIESTGEDSFGCSPKENLRFTVDWAYEVQLPDGMYVRPIAV